MDAAKKRPSSSSSYANDEEDLWTRKRFSHRRTCSNEWVLTKCLALRKWDIVFRFAGRTFLFLIGNGLEKIPCYPRQGFFFSSRLAYLSFFRKVFVKKCFCIIAVAIGLMKKKSFVEKSSFGGCSQKCLSGSHGRRIGHFINPHCLVSGRVWQTKVAVAVFGQELHRALPASTVQFFARALPRTLDSTRRARWA